MSAVLILLRIRNLALVEELEWQIGPAFVPSAGKSIIIGAPQLLLGERADLKQPPARSARLWLAVALRG